MRVDRIELEVVGEDGDRHRLFGETRTQQYGAFGGKLDQANPRTRWRLEDGTELERVDGDTFRDTDGNTYRAD